MCMHEDARSWFATDGFKATVNTDTIDSETTRFEFL